MHSCSVFYAVLLTGCIEIATALIGKSPDECRADSIPATEATRKQRARPQTDHRQTTENILYPDNLEKEGLYGSTPDRKVGGWWLVIVCGLTADLGLTVAAIRSTSEHSIL